MPCHVFTSIIANYLPKARVLAHSVKKFHPEFTFHLLLSDDIPQGFHLEGEPFDTVIHITELGIPGLRQWIFTHTIVELSTAVKGFGVKKLLEQPDCDHVLYLDPDIAVLSPLDRLIREFDSASVLLTPHICEPEQTLEAILDNEFSVLQHGIYNLGFLGVNNTEEGRRFASWWTDRLYDFCYDDIPRGIFTDQRWADLVPAYFQSHRVLRDPVYNVCTWNLTHRHISGNLQDGILANGQPVAFYHFSGFDSGAQEIMLNKYGAQMPVLFELRDWYIQESDRMGQQEYSKIPWAYANFDNGEPITKLQRIRYRDRGDLRAAFPDPFATADPGRSYYHWFHANDESIVRPSGTVDATPTARKPAEDPVYSVVLLVHDDDDPATIRESVITLNANTHASDRIFIAAGSEAALSNTGFSNLPTVPLSVGTADGVFAAALSHFADTHVILVRPGVLVPKNWDLRLAWSTERNPSVGVISPITPGLLETTGAGIVTVEPSVADAFVCYASAATVIDARAFSADCALVTSELLASVRRRGLRPTPETLAGIATEERYTVAIAPHLYAGETVRRSSVVTTTGPEHSEYPPSDILISLVDGMNSGRQVPVDASPLRRMRPRNLHVMHSWGGGLNRWVSEFCLSDVDHENFILKSVGHWGAFGSVLHLYRSIGDTEPLESWPLDPVISATATSHSSYQAILTGICHKYGFERIFVSSLIGHSLDVLRQEIPTALIAHDYYPLCPALNITFRDVCSSCDNTRLEACTRENPNNRFFLNVPPPMWSAIRRAFKATIRESSISIIAPSPSVREHYAAFFPEIAERFHIVPHGTRQVLSEPLTTNSREPRPLRIVVLGHLTLNKGLGLLRTIAAQLSRSTELYLVGCGETGSEFEELPGTTVVPSYDWEALGTLLGGIRPDLGLLLSTVPETFSYTLQELFDLRISPIATRLGSFCDRIQHGVNGFLVEPDPVSVLQLIGSLDRDRERLARVQSNLSEMHHRSLAEMHSDYDRIVPVPKFSARGYFAGRSAKRDHERYLQLFWRTSEAQFSEALSSVGFPYGSDRQIVRLPIPPQVAPVVQLRLDLSASPGFFVLHNLRLRGPDGAILWSWDHSLSLFDESPQINEIVPLQSEPGRVGLPLYFSGADPHIVLPVHSAILNSLRSGYVEVDLSPDWSRTSLARLVLKIQATANMNQSMSANLEQLRTATAELRNTARQQEDEIASLRQDLLASAVAQRSAAESFRDATTRITTQESQLRQFRQLRDAAGMRIAAQELEIRQLQDALQSLSKQTSDLQRSLTWRMTAPARLVAGGVMKLLNGGRRNGS